MLGGGFFAVGDMLLPQASRRVDKVQRFQSDNGDLAKRLSDHVYFEMSHAQPWGRAALECAVRVLGADHIIWGTSYPVRREWLLDGPAFVRELDVSDEEKDMMLAGNAKLLYHID